MVEEKMLKGEEGEALRIYWGTDRNNFQSEAQNKPVYDEVLFLEIYTPGSRESTPTYQAVRKYAQPDGTIQEHRDANIFQRYGKQLEAFLANNVDGTDMAGTPLSSLTSLERTQIASLNEARIFTVEGLAAISDEKLRVLGMEGRTLRSQAQAYLDNAQGGAAVAKLAQELEDVRGQLEVLRNRAETAEKQLLEVKPAPGSASPPPPPPATPAPAPASKPKPNVATDPAKIDGSDII